MSLGEKIEKLKFDTRMRDINIKNGVVDKKQVEQELSNIPDSAANSVHLDFKHEMGTTLKADSVAAKH